MEADRGQADIATVLSVGVHTSPCTGPGPDPITQTCTHSHTHAHTHSYLSDGGSDPGVGGSSSCIPAVVWDSDLRGVS